ncbi:ABC transporter permease [Geosporobacter ferrireducens]|uniref:ABC transporter permease n=1 Tax=Geosporobacter ferrireducens TaxID=1424294 RepID=UPI00139E371D|nr:ABC transporter permease [Geosporobacter ferrireducens]MTI53317.1 ABC transporter permease [Geosporobacter ferrireducens]
MFKEIKEIYSYRGMLYNLVKKDLRTRYKGSALGFLWTFLNPLLMLVVYTLVFSTIMRVNVENYPMFLFVALMPWIFFANSVQISSQTILGNSSLVKKIYFPREILPLALVIGGLVNYLLTFIVIILALNFFGFNIQWLKVLLNIPLILIIQSVLVYGFCLLFSSLNVYFRDLEHILGIVIMAWVYITPVLYPVELIPENYTFVYKLNPMSSIIIAYRDVLYYGKNPNYKDLFIILIVSLIIYQIGKAVFNKLKKGFAEEI